LTWTPAKSLQRSVDSILVPGIVVVCRRIAQGDENALWPEELPAFAGSVVKVRRASGAARIAARDLMQNLGLPPAAIVKSAAGVPIWPEGIVGSLAHDAEVAVAALAKRQTFASLGIDVEPAEPLAEDLIDIVVSRAERRWIEDGLHQARLLFSIKEAVYKAVYPLDGVFLDHHDVEIDLPAGLAQVKSGRTVDFRYCVDKHIVTLAFIRT